LKRQWTAVNDDRCFGVTLDNGIVDRLGIIPAVFRQQDDIDVDLIKQVSLEARRQSLMVWPACRIIRNHTAPGRLTRANPESHRRVGSS
jgi:hypothetical protein